jgi:hypothetical protein
VIAVNNCYQRAPWADVIYGCDRRWWDEYAERAGKICTGEFWTVNPTAAAVYGLNALSYVPGGGISSRPSTIAAGGNSGFQAVGIALLFGAAKVVLLGFDMQQGIGRRLHWHTDHGGKLHNPTPQSLKNWNRCFEQLAKVAPVPIVNASRETALTCFPRRSISEALGG